MTTTADTLQNSNLIVIKIGSVLVRGDKIDEVNQPWMNALAEDVDNLIHMGKKVVIVSSGGIALGRKALSIPTNLPPNQIPLAKKQAASSVGQFHVFNGYHKAFQNKGITAAQVLLTISETENRRTHLNARETLHTLLEHNIIPIINENDAITTEEIRFGDNDRLAVRVAQMIGADSVIILSTIDGLYTDNPQNNPQAEHIPVIENITEDHVKMAGEAAPGLSTGGMKSKLEAAQSATKSGIHLIITDGREQHALKNLINSSLHGAFVQSMDHTHKACDDDSVKSTLFLAEETDKNARKSWIGAHMNPKGIVTIDDGAYKALQSGKSLLPVGVKSIEGTFQRGDIVEIQTQDGNKIAKGIVAYSSNDAQKLIGQNSGDIASILGYIGREELVHRNDMVML